MRSLTITALQIAALLSAALVCAAVSNGLAQPQRRLAWLGAPIPPATTLPAAESLPPPNPSPNLPAVLRAEPAKKTPRKSAPGAPTEKQAAFALRPGQPVREIASEEAAEARRAGVPFLDSRRSAEYELGHIAGAWSLPVWESTLEERLTEFEAKANPLPEAPLVLYCSGGGCEDSHLLASRLFKLGYRNLLIYRDGYPDWVAKGRPTTTGTAR